MSPRPELIASFAREWGKYSFGDSPVLWRDSLLQDVDVPLFEFLQEAIVHFIFEAIFKIETYITTIFLQIYFR